MPNQRLFVENIVAFLGAMTVNWKRQLVTVSGRTKKPLLSNNQVKFATRNIKAKLFACDFSVQRVVTFGVLLYRNQ